MGKISLAVVILSLALFGLVAGGCATSKAPAARSTESGGHAAVQFGPLLDAEGNHRSLSLDSPLMADLTAADGRFTQRPEWYDGRRDSPASVDAGARTIVQRSSYTRSRDRLDSFDGTIRDDFNRNVFRETFIELDQ